MREIEKLVYGGLSLCLIGILIFSSLLVFALPPGFISEQVLTDLNPTAITQAPDGRLFIAMKDGRVMSVRDDIMQPDPYVSLEVDNFNERGLLGIVLHPDFEQNQWVYLYYSIPSVNMNRLSRFTGNGDFIIPGSETILMEFGTLASTIHNGGAMQFGQDGKLYVTTGEGADTEVSQSLVSLQGKVLRLNDDGSIPSDNPMVSQTDGVYQAIYALGFRNPYSMDIQPGTGRIFVNDVGSNAWEEVNEVLSGQNYGWPILEGYVADEDVPENYEDPFYAYDHDTGCAIVGAAFYNPAIPSFPMDYHNKYFFTDYCGGYVQVLDPETGMLVETFTSGINRPLDMLVTPEGDMYYLERAGEGGGSQQDNTGTNDGSLWKIVYTGSGAPFVSRHPSDILVSVGEDATFSISASGEPILSYQWQKDGQDLVGANVQSYMYNNAQIEDDGAEFRCVVTNAEGRDTSLSALLSVTTNTRPVPEIIEPAEGFSYRAGQTFEFRGAAFDAEDGNLEAAGLSWWIDFHHDEHEHPGLDLIDEIDIGSYDIPRVGETSTNVWYRIYLRATDSQGLSRTVYRDIFPVTSMLTLTTTPPGFSINLDGKLVETPHSTESVVGILRTLKAPAGAFNENSFLLFDSWTGGGSENLMSFYASDNDTVINAEYFVFPVGMGNGLTGYYFSGQVEPGNASAANLKRIDPVINFNWGDNSPAEGIIGKDEFAVRWKGKLHPLLSGAAKIHLTSDDGVRMWLDNELIIDGWQHQAATQNTAEVVLDKETLHDIQIEYFERSGPAQIRLDWSISDLSPRLIPQSQLYDVGLHTYPLSNPTDELMLWPNPTAHEIRLVLPEIWESESELVIYDVCGHKVFQSQLSGDKDLFIDVKWLQAGIYVLEMKHDAKRSVSKFIRK